MELQVPQLFMRCINYTNKETVEEPRASHTTKEGTWKDFRSFKRKTGWFNNERALTQDGAKGT